MTAFIPDGAALFEAVPARQQREDLDFKAFVLEHSEHEGELRELHRREQALFQRWSGNRCQCRVSLS